MTINQTPSLRTKAFDNKWKGGEPDESDEKGSPTHMQANKQQKLKVKQGDGTLCISQFPILSSQSPVPSSNWLFVIFH